MATLGQAVLPPGVLADRPTDNTPGKAGRLYFATDRNKLYRDNGTTWDIVLDAEIPAGTYLGAVSTDTSLTGDGTPGNPLAVVPDTNVYLETVAHDETITGDGTPGNPLSAVPTSTGGGHTIKSADATLPQRANLKIIGATIIDDAAADTTRVEIPILSVGGEGGGVSHTYVGKETAGNADETLSVGYAYIKKITMATGGLLTNVSALLKGNGGNVSNFVGLVFADVAGSPGKLLLAPPPQVNGVYSLFLNSTYGWVSFPAGIWLPAGDYWIGFYAYTAAGFQKLSKVAGGSDKVIYFNAAWVGDADMYSSGTSAALADYSIRGSVIATTVGAGVQTSPRSAVLLMEECFVAIGNPLGRDNSTLYFDGYMYADTTHTATPGNTYELGCVLQAGTYKVRIESQRYTTHGMIDILIDDVVVGVMDLYNNGWQDQYHFVLTGVTVPTDGYHKFSFVASSKNAAATGYRFACSSVHITPEAGY